MELKSGAWLGMPHVDSDVAEKMIADSLTRDYYFARRVSFEQIHEWLELAEERLLVGLFDGLKAVDY